MKFCAQHWPDPWFGAMWLAYWSPKGQQIPRHCFKGSLSQYPGLGWPSGQDRFSRQLNLGSRGRSRDSDTRGTHGSQQAALTSAQYDPLLQTAPWEQMETTQGTVETTLQN